MSVRSSSQGFGTLLGRFGRCRIEHCVDVARVLYETLRDEGMTDAAVCKGLHRAVRELRYREVPRTGKREMPRWCGRGESRRVGKKRKMRVRTFRDAGARNDELILGSVRTLWCVEVYLRQNISSLTTEHVSHFNQEVCNRWLKKPALKKPLELGKDAVVLWGPRCDVIKKCLS